MHKIANSKLTLLAIVAVVAVLFVITNMIVDVIYTAVDPRVSVQERD